MNGNLEGNFTHGEIGRMSRDERIDSLDAARSDRALFLAGTYRFEWPDGSGTYQLLPEHEETEIAYLDRDIWNLVQALRRC